MEVPVKFLWAVPFLVCSLLAAGGIVVVASTSGEAPIALAASAPLQDSSANSGAASLSGNWQMSWTSANGAQRQGTMEIKQDGTKLSGKFQGERGSAAVTGSLDGNQVSLKVRLPRRQVSFSGTVNGDKMSGTTEQGASWTATRPQG
jgi:hypothetical protein